MCHPPAAAVAGRATAARIIARENDWHDGGEKSLEDGRSLAGKYEVLKMLGRGGMGEVYLVRHVDLGVQYAVKVLNSALSANERFIEQFKTEASVLTTFSHPGVTQLRDFGRTEEGRYYLAMDVAEGRSLKYILDNEGPYPVRGALRIMIQLLGVLESAHRQGIVHRDIKPANIMIVGDDNTSPGVRVLDFGTALLRGTFDPNTGEYSSLGTPCYMSPEQASGASNIDHRVDIYGSGILMYELLTGDVPFEGEDVIQTLLMHITHPPVPFAALYGIPEYIERVVFKAIDKKRDSRFRTAEKFRDACKLALQKYLEEGSGSSKAAGEAPPAKVQQKAPTPVPKATPSKAVEKKQTRILCLDDDEMILNIMQHLLEMNGYEVFTASDCSSIHDYLFQEKVDLLLSDVQMPGLPGTKVCKLIKSSLADLKVVFFSNLPDRDLERFTEENGADGWISKQTRPEDWLSAINEITGSN